MTICLKCKTEFDPPGGLPSRRVCAKCIANRPGHLRDKTDNAGSTAAALKRGQAVKVLMQREQRKPPSSVSVGYEPLTDDQLAAMVADFDQQWRQRNVIPFPNRRAKPSKPPFSPGFGPEAA